MVTNAISLIEELLDNSDYLYFYTRVMLLM